MLAHNVYESKLGYEWDETKRRNNLAKHQMNFEMMADFEWGNALIERSDRHGEIRWSAIGYIGVRICHVAFTMRDENIRIISLRAAKSSEVRRYAKA